MFNHTEGVYKGRTGHKNNYSLSLLNHRKMNSTDAVMLLNLGRYISYIDARKNQSAE